MKTWLKQNWFKLVIILLVILAFFWFEWRPTQIEKSCIRVATDSVEFRKCLLENGYPLKLNSNNN